MLFINKVEHYIKDSEYRMITNSLMGLYHFKSDKKYITKLYKISSGKDLDLDNPKSFNEKLQWLKLYDRRPEYTMMVDKYAVKEYVAKEIGNEYIIPTLGVWNHFDEINFAQLPNQFVLKCTHDSGGLFICRDKNIFNKKKVKKKINHCLKKNFFWIGREWPYKNVEPRIIAEKYMEDRNGEQLIDYKFYCFNGEPKFLYISKGLEVHSTAQISFLTLDWKFAPFGRDDYASFTQLPEKPKHFDDMISIAKKLSIGHCFLRVDLYEINGHIYFSELTFTPCSGFMPFNPIEYDLILGDMITLPRG